MQDTDAKPFRQETGQPLGLRRRSEPAFEIIDGFRHVRIDVADRFRIRLGIQALIAKQIGAIEIGLFRQSPHIHVVFGEERRIVPIGIEDAAQTESDRIKQEPSDECQVGHEAFPLVPLHHAPRQVDGVQCADIRVLGDDVGNHTIGIALDESSDYGERPEEHERGGHEHDPCHAEPFAGVDRVQEPACRKLSVGAALQQHSAHDDFVCLPDEQPYEYVDDHGQYDRDDHRRASVVHDGIDRIEDGYDNRSG